MINYGVCMTRYRPAYELETVKQLAREGKFMLFQRPFHFMLNRYDGADPAEIAVSVIEAIQDENFHKSDELKNRPGTYADIYKGIECADYPEEPWYAKIVLSDDGAVILEIWSLNWEDYIH